jgi:hypothetical protein
LRKRSGTGDRTPGVHARRCRPADRARQKSRGDSRETGSELPDHADLVERCVSGGRSSNSRAARQKRQRHHDLQHGKLRSGRRAYGDSIVNCAAVTLATGEVHNARSATRKSSIRRHRGRLQLPVCAV